MSFELAYERPRSTVMPLRDDRAARAKPGTINAMTDLERAASLANLLRVIDRVVETVDQETAALRNRTPIDLKDFNNRKSHGLLDLTRAMRPFDGAAMDEPVRAKLTLLRTKLDENRAVLALHIEAVREIATTMADAIREVESDGTYSASIGRRGQVA